MIIIRCEGRLRVSLAFYVFTQNLNIPTQKVFGATHYIYKV